MIVWSETFYECSADEQQALIDRFLKMKQKAAAEIEESGSAAGRQSVNQNEKLILDGESSDDTAKLAAGSGNATMAKGNLKELGTQRRLSNQYSNASEANGATGQNDDAEVPGSSDFEPHRKTPPSSVNKYENNISRSGTEEVAEIV